MPNVSVIIATRNRPDLLPKAINSARRAGRDVEIIVVDDASSDETVAVCKSIADIKYVRVDRNQQVAGARNIGLVASSGDYITFLDDDDLRLPGSLDEQIEALERTPDAAFVYGQAIPETENGERGEPFPMLCPQGDIFWPLLARNFIPCGSVVVRRSALIAIGLLDDAIPGIDDWDLWVRVTEIFPTAAVQYPVIVWRQSFPDSVQGSSNTVDVIAKASRHFRRAFTKLPRFAAASRVQQRRAWQEFSKHVAEHLAWNIFSELRQGGFSRAFRSARTLWLLHPIGLWFVCRRWMNLRTVKALIRSAATQRDLADAKTNFKKLRSNLDEDEDRSLQKSF